jgi:uncharacterized protein YjbJ (UPF0337 family)
MNEDIIKGKWHEVKGKIKHKWGQLTDDDIDQMQGSSEELQGLLQKRYGYEREVSKKEIEEFIRENKWH